MHPAFTETSHRPWPLPSSPWRWRQSWLDLAFLHYRIEPATLQRLLPPGLEIDTFDGCGWIGVVPFRMAGVMRRPLPDFPGFSSFPELNVRTYVVADGKPGVWFFSLDAASWPLVLGGRYVYGLPYHHAVIRQWKSDGGYRFTSVRGRNAASFSAFYRPVGPVYLAEAGSFDHWASERYCLYALSRSGVLRRVHVHHAPWPLQKAEVSIERITLLAAAGLHVTGEPVSHFSSGVHAVSYDVENVSCSSA